MLLLLWLELQDSKLSYDVLTTSEEIKERYVCVVVLPWISKIVNFLITYVLTLLKLTTLWFLLRSYRRSEESSSSIYRDRNRTLWWKLKDRHTPGQKVIIVVHRFKVLYAICTMCSSSIIIQQTRCYKNLLHADKLAVVLWSPQSGSCTHVHVSWLHEMCA